MVYDHLTNTHPYTESNYKRSPLNTNSLRGRSLAVLKYWWSAKSHLRPKHVHFFMLSSPGLDSVGLFFKIILFIFIFIIYMLILACKITRSRWNENYNSIKCNMLCGSKLINLLLMIWKHILMTAIQHRATLVHRLMRRTKQKPFIQRSCHINQPLAAWEQDLKYQKVEEEVRAIKEPLAAPLRKSH